MVARPAECRSATRPRRLERRTCAASDPESGALNQTRVHPYLFRYGAATWMLTKRVDPLTIARVIGWTSLRMLQRIYDQASPEDDFQAMASLLRAAADSGWISFNERDWSCVNTLEREMGVSRSGATYSAVEVRYQPAGSR